MAATLSHLPTFLSLFSQKLFLLDPQQQQANLRYTAGQRRPPPPHFALRASSVKKKTRKVKSNAELCNELREFLTAVGLPEGHVPSMKELSHHGRNDLAYIVRRRGYKLIRELLSDSTKTDICGNADNSVPENQDAVDDPKEMVTGQDQEVNDVVEDFSSSCEVSNLEDISGSLTQLGLNHDDSGRAPVESSVDSHNLEGHSDFSSSSEVSILEDNSGGLTQLNLNHGDSGRAPMEFSVDSYNLEDLSEEVDNVDANCFASTRDHITEDHPSSSKIGPAFNSDNRSNMTFGISTNPSLGVLDELSLPTTVPVKENNSCNSNMGWDLNSEERPSLPIESVADSSSDGKVLDSDQDGKVDNMAEEVSSSTRVSVMEDHSGSNLEPTNNSDHHSCAPLESSASSSLEEKVASFMKSGDLDAVEENSKNVLDGSESSDATMALNWRTSTCEQLLPSTTVDPCLSTDDSTSAEALSSPSEKDLDIKASEKEDEHYMSNLKFMLHQKEMELYRLKEQIENEKLALSMLQTKAETAIRKAQKLVSEKDAELLAAEESLSGLVEVEIQYCGDGEIVEVTGSFNGWHHQIEMDPRPSSSIKGSMGLRKPRLWSTNLWLYPGIYEIKFIVDGQWKLDPQRESVTTGTICNNILRVEG